MPAGAAIALAGLSLALLAHIRIMSWRGVLVIVGAAPNG